MNYVIADLSFGSPVAILCIACCNILSFSLHTGRFIMYSGITKIYYRKTVRHVFTKPVQIEGTNKKPFSQ